MNEAQAKAHVRRYHIQFQESEDELNNYLVSIGQTLTEAGRVPEPLEFVAELERKIEKRESARIKLEQAVREKRVGWGPITVHESVKTTYNGEYLHHLLKKAAPEIHSEIISVEYKVDNKKLKKLIEQGGLTEEQLKIATLKETTVVNLKGKPSKIGLG